MKNEENYEVIDVFTRRIIGYTNEDGYDKFVETVCKLYKRGITVEGIYPNIIGFKNRNLIYVGVSVGFGQ
jgi:hypothetical protein